MRSLVFLAVLSLVLWSSAAVFAVQEYAPGGDNFESYAVGTLLTTVAAAPEPKSNVWGDSATYTAGSRYDIVEKAELDGNPDNQVVRIVDIATTTVNTHLRTNFWLSPWQTSGVFAVTMDVKPLQTNGPFKVAMTRGAWTSAGDTLCALAFGSTGGNTFFPGMTTGAKLGLQTTTTAWVDTSVAYTADTWYTVKFIVDVDLRKYQVFFGERGGVLAEVTSGLTPWITGGTVWQIAFAGMIFATSNKGSEGAQLLVDNVSETQVPTNRIVWDSFYRVDSYLLGTTEDPTHYVWENGYNSLGCIGSKEMVFGTVTDPSDGAFLNNYAPAAVDISARVRSVGGNGAGIAYRKDPAKEAGNPGYGYRLFWSQDGTSVILGYYWFGELQGSVCTYTPSTAINWAVAHTVRIKAVGSSHKVWLDGALIIDWADSHSLDGGHVIFYRVHSWYYVDDFFMLEVPPVEVSSAAAVRALEIGVPVVLSGSELCVSGAYNGFFYLEDFNRASGIKVVSPQFVTLGNLVTVKGTVKSADGEKYIDATSAVPDSSSFVTQPLGMNGRSHGAGPGLSNIALLTRIWGVVTWVAPDFMSFCVDDGSGVSHEPGLTGIRVCTDGYFSPPGVGDYVACTGVASMDAGGIPIIRMRSYLDMDILKLALP